MFKRAVEWIDSIDSLFYLLASIALNRITDWIPKFWYVRPFPFYEIVDKSGQITGITVQNYYFYITGHLTMIMFWNFAMKKIPTMAQLLFFYRAVEIIALLDFLLIFEKAFMHVGSYGVEFTDIRVLVYFTLYILWKAGK